MSSSSSVAMPPCRRALNSVDYAASGEPIGWEITALHQVTIAQVNAVLTRLGLAAMAPEKLAPLHAA